MNTKPSSEGGREEVSGPGMDGSCKWGQWPRNARGGSAAKGLPSFKEVESGISEVQGQVTRD